MVQNWSKLGCWGGRAAQGARSKGCRANNVYDLRVTERAYDAHNVFAEREAAETAKAAAKEVAEEVMVAQAAQAAAQAALTAPLA